MRDCFRILLFTYLLALTVCVMPALAMQSQSTTELSVSFLEVGGNYDLQPVIQNFYINRQSYAGNFPSVMMQLRVLKLERDQFKSLVTKQVAAEKVKLKAEHRKLMVAGSTRSDSDLNSDWALDMSRNISQQAQLMETTPWKMVEWDKNHPVVVRFRMINGKKWIHHIVLPNRKQLSVAIAYLD
jgi:hypothetical protein